MKIYTFYFFTLLLFLCGHARAQQRIDVPRADGATTPLIAYEPKAARGCAPLVLLSHGAGGSEERGLRYLGEALARDGWRAIALGHRESGMPVLRKDMRADGFHAGIAALVTDTSAYKARFMDIDAALKWSQSQCHAPYKVLAGHSMGAITVMLQAGARNKLSLNASGAFDAYVALSPEGPGIVFPDNAWQPIKAPMLLITGTKDKGLDGDWAWRMQAFDGLGAGACRWLAVFDGATHMNFGGLDLTDHYKARTAALVTQYLDGVRSGRCPNLTAAPGITLRSK
ncbi:MAG: alpha/beta hydrolase [Gammaproteobacteria bacterium]|nr:MAG: alpha/beta hydrolase [Gammaproteobacteria bacterium]